METTTDLLVEVHVPLVPTPDLDPEDQFDWIDTILDFLEEVQDSGDAAMFDEGESLDDVYVFSIHDASEDELLAVARRERVEQPLKMEGTLLSNRGVFGRRGGADGFARARFSQRLLPR